MAEFRHKMANFVTKTTISSQCGPISSQKFIKWFFGGIFATLKTNINNTRINSL